MAKYEIILTDAEEKILLSEIKSINDWIQNAIQNRLRHALINCIDEYTDLNYKKLTKEQMVSTLTNINIKSAEDKEADLLKSLKKVQ